MKQRNVSDKWIDISRALWTLLAGKIYFHLLFIQPYRFSGGPHAGKCMDVFRNQVLPILNKLPGDLCFAFNTGTKIFGVINICDREACDRYFDLGFLYLCVCLSYGLKS
jgi:hypothetical protein